MLTTRGEQMHFEHCGAGEGARSRKELLDGRT
jgi:hypothetical protein